MPAQLSLRTQDHPGRDFLAVGGDWLTAEQFRDRARRLAAGLYRIGIRPGDRVASIMPNRIEAAELLFACAELFDEPAAQPPWPAPEPGTLMTILYTSGTTGLPKGCMITHGYMLHWPQAHLMFGWFTPADTSISTLPLYHGFGLSGLMSTLASGGRIRFEPEFHAGTLIRRARETGATQLWAVGAIGAALLATPPGPGDKDHALERCVFIPMAPAAQHQFEERFGTPGTTVEPKALFAYFRENLPYDAIPRCVQVLDELPANAVGRVLKHKLRDSWDAPGTIDFQALGLTVEKSARRLLGEKG